MKLMQNVELSDRGDESNNILTSIICSAGLLLCMVFAIFGIKFRWFKHRLSFQQLPDTSDRGGGTSTNSQNGGVIPLQGVFRRREDADSFVEIERPKTLPPIRIRSTDVQLPVPNRLSQITPTHSSSGTENTNQPPNPPPMPNNAASSATLNKNRSERSNRSQASSRSKSSERSKKSDDQTTVSAKSTSSSTSPRKKKGHDDAKSKSTPAAVNPQYSEVNKKRRDKDKEKEKSRKPATGVTFESRKPKKHSDQTRHFEKLKDDRPNAKAAGERRPTGFIRPNDEEMEVLEKLASLEDMNNLPADGLSDNDEENQAIFEKVKAKPVPEPRKRISNENATAPIPPPPVASVASKPTDSWSAVARHRILTEELTKQHSALKPVGMDSRSNGAGEFRNPLSASSQSSESKPRTMRDMKKSKDIMSHSDRVVLGQEQQRDDTEA